MRGTPNDINAVLASGSGWQRLCNRFGFAALDALLTAPLGSPISLPAALRIAISLRSSNYRRVGALSQVLDRCVPGAGSWMSHKLRRYSKLPLDRPQLDLLGYGSGGTVFRVRTPQREGVLKAYRRTLGAGIPELLAAAAFYRDKYETLQRWYEGSDVVVETRFLIQHSPLVGLRAVCSWQPKLEDPLEDLFQLPMARLETRAREDVELRRVLVGFARKSVVLHTAGVFPDFVGEGNVVLCPSSTTPGRWCLRLLDFGHFDLEQLRDARLQDAIAIRCDRLRQIVTDLAE